MSKAAAAASAATAHRRWPGSAAGRGLRQQPGPVTGERRRPGAARPASPAPAPRHLARRHLAAPAGLSSSSAASAAQHDNFWELFVRSRRARRLEAGHAAGRGEQRRPRRRQHRGRALLTAVPAEPGPDLLAARDDHGPGVHWSQGTWSARASPTCPDALAGAHGQLLALTATGTVEPSTPTSAPAGARLATPRLAGPHCGRPGLRPDQPVRGRFDAAGHAAGRPATAQPGRRGHPVRSSGRRLAAAGPALPAALGARHGVSVLGLAISGRTTALLAVGQRRLGWRPRRLVSGRRKQRWTSLHRSCAPVRTGCCHDRCGRAAPPGSCWPGRAAARRTRRELAPARLAAAAWRIRNPGRSDRQPGSWRRRRPAGRRWLAARHR